MATRRNPLGFMEDPIKGIIIDAIARIDKDYVIRSIDVVRDEGELRIVVELRPRREGATISTWRIIDIEDRITALLGINAELSHSRVGVSPDGYLLLIYTIRSADIKPLEKKIVEEEIG